MGVLSRAPSGCFPGPGAMPTVGGFSGRTRSPSPWAYAPPLAAAAEASLICRGLGRESSDAAGQAPDGGPDVNPGCASAGGAAEALSCESGGLGLTTCGSSQHDCCCTSLEVVPNGSFYRSYENAGSGLAAEADPATVSGFRLDKYLVTVGRFRQFVAAWSGGWSTAPGSGKHAHLSAGRGLADSSAPGSYETGWDGQWDSMVAPSDANLICGSGNDTWTPSAASNESLPINCTTWYEAYAFCIWDGGFLGDAPDHVENVK